MPNPWDVGTARSLERMGFAAVATSSAACAWALGKSDNAITLEEALAHLRTIASAVSIPVNADFEGGFTIAPEGVARNVTRAVETGVAGLSIEDSTGDPERPLFDVDLATDRMRAAREAIDRSGAGVVLTGRSEGFIAGRPDIDETVKRLRAYAAAGADCLYAPGIRTPEDIITIVTAVSPKPVNLLVHADFITLADAAALGVRRISTGGALARAAWTGFLRAAQEMRSSGTFGELGAAVSSRQVTDAFGPSNGTR